MNRYDSTKRAIRDCRSECSSHARILYRTRDTTFALHLDSGKHAADKKNKIVKIEINWGKNREIRLFVRSLLNSNISEQACRWKPEFLEESIRRLEG